MNAVIAATLGLIEEVLPLVSAGGSVAKIITVLEEVVPLILKEYNDLVPIAKNIISALKSHDAVTEDEWTQLETLEQKIDAEFEDVAAKTEE